MEYLDIVDENGVPTGKIAERTAAHKQGLRHRTSMSGSCGNGQEKSRYCCRKEVRIKIPFRAVTIFPAPDISLQG